MNKMADKITVGERLALLKNETNEYLRQVCYSCGYFRELQELKIEPAKWYACIISNTMYLEIKRMIEEHLCIQVHINTSLTNFGKKFMEDGKGYVKCKGLNLNIQPKYISAIESMLIYYRISAVRHGEHPLKSNILESITKTRNYYDYLNALSTVEIRRMNPMDLCKVF